MSSGFPPFQPSCVLWFPEVRVGLLCMLQTKNCLCLRCRSIWKPPRTWAMCGNVAFCGTRFIVKSYLEGFRDSGVTGESGEGVASAPPASLTVVSPTALPPCATCAFSFYTFRSPLCCCCLFFLTSPVCCC